MMDKTLIRFNLFLFALLLSSPAFAWHTTSGTVKNIYAYANTDTVLVELSTHGAAVPECSNTKMFAINGAHPESRRNQMLTLLLTAKATGTRLSVAYNTSGGCVPYGGNNSAYREILRIIY